MSNQDKLQLSYSDMRRILYVLPGLSDEERGDVVGSDTSFLHICFGVVPNTMSYQLLAKFARTEEFQVDTDLAFPLCPMVQSSWNGEKLADWLITAKLVSESKRPNITAKLTGKHFLAGCVLGVLTKADIRKISKSVSKKAKSIASKALILSQSSDQLKSAICALFSLEPKDLCQNADLGKLLESRFLIVPEDLYSFDSLGLRAEQEWKKLVKISMKEQATITSADFKRGLTACPYLSDDESDEIRRTNVTYLHLHYGVVPDQMSIQLFTKIAAFKELSFANTPIFPLYPIVQESWSGKQLADWLISTGKVHESKHSIISEKLTGQLFLRGQVLGVLDDKSRRDIYRLLEYKADFAFKDASALIARFSESIPAVCSVLNLNPQRLTNKEMKEDIENQYSPWPQAAFRYDDPEGCFDDFIIAAFQQQYLFKPLIAKSFITHLKNIVSKKEEGKYFASYTTISQSSCMGKSRLLAESLEHEDTALFIIRLNCRPRGDARGYPKTANETGLVVERLLESRSQGQVAAVLRALLYLVLKAALDDSNYLKDQDNLSRSMEDFGITDSMIANTSRSCEVVGDAGLAMVSKMIDGMKLRKDDSTELKVLPIVAFDEASHLIKENFILKYDKRPIFEERVEINTFRLIRRVLHTDREKLWGCPFVFVSTNTSFLKLVPPFIKSPGFGDEYGDMDGVYTKAHELFDPYILTLPFDSFAWNENTPRNEIHDWKEYTQSSTYISELINYGRPMWGSIAISRTVRNITKTELLNRIITLSQVKIKYILYKKDRDVPAAMAIAGVLASADWSVGEHSDTLVERHMALLESYTSERHKHFITYPSEPVLAYSALHYLRTNVLKIFLDLQTVEIHLFNTSFGDYGAFLSRLLFLLCVPDPTLEKPYCKMKDFLMNFLGSEKFRKIEKKKSMTRLLEGYCCFSHFHILQELCDTPYENLSVLVCLNAAVAMPRDDAEVDSIIPVVLEDGSLGSINIQVTTLHKSIYDPTEINSRMWNDCFCSPDHPRMNIVMNMSPFVNPMYEVHEDDNTTTIFLEELKNCTGSIFRSCGLGEQEKDLFSALRYVLSHGMRDLLSDKMPFKGSFKGLANFLDKTSV
jgi:hypothetical protein